MKHTLRDYQREATKALFSYLKLTKGVPDSNPLIQCPTGSGKSLIQAFCIERIMKYRPSSRILCLCHKTDIIDQNYQEFINFSDLKDVGIYCSNLKRKDDNCVLFSSIQSISRAKNRNMFYDVLFIDEAHLCNNKSQGEYRKLIKTLQEVNPNIRIVGLTATPWRMDGGCLLTGEERIFTCIVYKITIKELIEKGYLVPIVTPVQELIVKPDLSCLVYSNAAKDYTIASQDSVMDLKLEEIVEEAIHVLKDRKHIAVFCPSIKICRRIIELLKLKGETADLYIGETETAQRKKIKKNFENAEIKYLVSAIATTIGFDSKCIDGILNLRVTGASNFWVQLLGRGMRIFLGKVNCLLLDYGENILRHGPLEEIEAPPQKTKKGDGIFEMVKMCPKCNSKIAISRKECHLCGYEYPIIERRYKKLTMGVDVLYKKSNYSEIEEFEVINSRWELHSKNESEKSIKIDHLCKNGISVMQFLKFDSLRWGGILQKDAIRLVEKMTMGSYISQHLSFAMRIEMLETLCRYITEESYEKFMNYLQRHSINDNKYISASKIKTKKVEKYYRVLDLDF